MRGPRKQCLDAESTVSVHDHTAGGRRIDVVHGMPALCPSGPRDGSGDLTLSSVVEEVIHTGKG